MDIKTNTTISMSLADKIRSVTNAHDIVTIHLEGGDSIEIPTKKMKEVFDHLDPKDMGFKLTK